MEKLLSLNFGQHILYGYICTSIQGRKQSELTIEDLEEILKQVIQLTHHSNYEYTDECPDVMIMTTPEKSYDIFCDFWDENEVYFAELF